MEPCMAGLGCLVGMQGDRRLSESTLCVFFQRGRDVSDSMKLRGVSDPPELVRCIPDLVVRIRDCSDYEIRFLVEYINFGESSFVLVPPG